MFAELTSGKRLFFDIEGAGLVVDGPRLVRRPTVLLVHGAEVDHSFFKPWVSPLAGRAQLLYVDLLGHGRSDPGEPDDWTPESWATSLSDLADTLGVRGMVVVGSSMGGRVALHLALQAPNLVAGLVLVNTFGRPRPDRRIEMFRRLGGDEAAEAARDDIDSPSHDTKDAYFRLCMPLLTQRPYTADEVARLTPPAPGVFDRLVELSRAPWDLLPAARNVACPTLVMTGELDPAATPEDAVDLAVAIGDNATAHIVKHAGHGVYRDRPEEFARVVGEWIAAL